MYLSNIYHMKDVYYGEPKTSTLNTESCYPLQCAGIYSKVDSKVDPHAERVQIFVLAIDP